MNVKTKIERDKIISKHVMRMFYKIYIIIIIIINVPHSRLLGIVKHFNSFRQKIGQMAVTV